MRIEITEKFNSEKLPQLIQIFTDHYILSKNSDGSLILYSAECPHRQGVVEKLEKDIWTCPSHDWNFDPKNGNCINAPQAHLKSFSVVTEDNKLFVNLPEKPQKFLKKSTTNTILPKITLVSNACLLIEWDGKNILTDPWIDGPAIYDSWIHYPPLTIEIEKLPNIDFILISHEHSDHFHKKTLEQLDKNIPIIVPQFREDRLFHQVKKLGFKNVSSLESEKNLELVKDINLIFFKSNLWNDSVIFLQLGNFKILNVNDAGFNWNIPKIIGDVDLVASSFSFGASAYPLNWSHLKMDIKKEIMIAKNIGILKMIKQIVDACNAKFFLPFANFNELGPKRLRKIAQLQIKNTPRNVSDFFKNDKVEVWEMFPGEFWDGSINKIFQRKDHQSFLNRNNVIEYLEKNYNEEIVFPDYSISVLDIKKYFEKFSGSELAKDVGKYNILFTIFDEQKENSVKISFSQGVVKVSENIDDSIDMKMRSPGHIVQDIIENDLSWDEIQYWSEYSRKNGEYNIAFWKIMHAPWEAKLYIKLNYQVDNNTAIATIIEKGGKEAIAIFEEFGLYCASCDASIGENVEEGCKMHGLSKEDTRKLIVKINKFLKSRN